MPRVVRVKGTIMAQDTSGAVARWLYNEGASFASKELRLALINSSNPIITPAVMMEIHRPLDRLELLKVPTRLRPEILSRAKKVEAAIRAYLDDRIGEVHMYALHATQDDRERLAAALRDVADQIDQR